VDSSLAGAVPASEGSYPDERNAWPSAPWCPWRSTSSITRRLCLTLA